MERRILSWKESGVRRGVKEKKVSMANKLVEGKYEPVKSMLNSSTRIFSFQFSFMDGFDAMLENGPWFIRNNPLILKKWNPDVNLLKEDVGNVPDKSSYARALIEIRADVELKDNIVVVMSNLLGRGSIREEYPMNIDVDVAKILKKPSQAPRGVSVGLKVGFKQAKHVYRVVSKKPNSNSSKNKKKNVELTKESRPNGKLIHNSILNGLYVRKMIPGPGDANREITVTETFHLQTDDELFDKELKQIKADNQAMQTILFGLPEDIYAAVDSCKTAQEIWLRVQQMMKGSDIGIQEKKAKLFNEWERFTSNEGESIESYYHRFLKLMNDLKRNKYFPEKIASNLKFLNNLQQPMPNPKDITDPTTAMNMALALMAKAFKLNYSTPTNNNQRISSKTRNRQIAQPGMNIGEDRQMQMVEGNGGNQFRQYAGQNARNLAGYNDVIGNQVNQNAVQNLRVQNVRNHNGLIGVQGNGNQNQIGNGNLMAARAEGNVAGQNGNQIRCYNCRGKKETGIQLQPEEYDLMAAVADLDEIKEVNANCILMANLQQASTSGTQTDSAPVYDTDGSAENNNDAISEDTSMGQAGETVEQHPVNFEETHALYESLYQNLAIEVEKVKSVNLKLKETNADLTTELARFKNQERCFEINQEKYDKLERDEIFPIVNQVDARLQNFKIQFLKEAAKFVGDFKSLANEADASLAKHKALELEIKRLLKAVVSQDIMIIVQTESVVDTSDLYAKLWNDWPHTRTCLTLFLLHLFKKVSDQRVNTQDTSKNTKFAKQPIVENPSKNGKTNALSKPVTSNSVSTSYESNSVNNDMVIALGMFRINPDTTSKEATKVPNTVRASNKTKLITVSQPPVFTRKDVNSNLNTLSSTGVDNTKTRKPQPRSNTKNDRVPSASKSSQSKNKEAEVEEHHRNLLLSKNNKHISSACNNIKTDSQEVISNVVCAMCSKCLISVNHDKCLCNYMSGKNSCAKKQKAKVSVKEI
nr:hypothetical protein [Tanacetum cinerariifolium]